MAGDGTSVTVFGDLSKPATVLVEKISCAVGILFEPKRITRRAHAEAEAKRINALVDWELESDLERRAMARLVHQESRKQQNIESITAEAIAALPNDAKPENLDEDWIAHFFQECQTVSDKEMQTLWAKLLAGESTRPGAFAKRTVNCVSAMSKSDAELFTALCQFQWFHSIPVPFIFDDTLPIYTDRKITFTGLKHLESLGLVAREQGLKFQRQKPNIAIKYFEEEVWLRLPDGADELAIGEAFFTQAGEELSAICGAQPNSEYFFWVLKRWMDGGIAVSSKYPRV